MRFEDFNKNPIQAVLDELRGGDSDWKIVELEELPQEIRYALEVSPSRYEKLEQLLGRGVYLTMRTQKTVPPEVNLAIDNVSDLAQGGLTHLWIADFLGGDQRPAWSREDEIEAVHKGFDLEEELKKIQNYKNEHQKIFVISSGSINLSADEQNLIDQINLELARISGRILPVKIVAQAESRVEFTIEMTLLWMISLCLSFIFGAINFTLGEFLAVVLPGVLAEIYRAYQGHQAGFASWQIRAKAIRRLPYALASIFLAVLGLWLGEYTGLSVFLFSLAALVLPLSHLTSFLIGMRNETEKQKSLGKIGQNVSSLPQQADCVRIAAFASLPIAVWLLCGVFSSLAVNYFFLTGLGLYAWVIPSLAVGAWSAAQSRLFRLRLGRALGKSVYRTGGKA